MPRFAGEPTTNHPLARAVRADAARFQAAVDEHVRELGSFAVSDHYVTDAGLPLGKWFAEIRMSRRPAGMAAIVDAQVAWRWPTPVGASTAPWGEIAAALSRLEHLFASPAGAVAARRSLQGRGAEALPAHVRSAAALLQADYDGPASSSGLKRVLERWKVRSWRVTPMPGRSEHADASPATARVRPAPPAASRSEPRVTAGPATAAPSEPLHVVV
jgi:hypothetical protein